MSLKTAQRATRFRSVRSYPTRRRAWCAYVMKPQRRQKSPLCIRARAETHVFLDALVLAGRPYDDLGPAQGDTEPQADLLDQLLKRRIDEAAQEADRERYVTT